MRLEDSVVYKAMDFNEKWGRLLFAIYVSVVSAVFLYTVAIGEPTLLAEWSLETLNELSGTVSG